MPPTTYSIIRIPEGETQGIGLIKNNKNKPWQVWHDEAAGEVVVFGQIPPGIVTALMAQHNAKDTKWQKP